MIVERTVTIPDGCNISHRHARLNAHQGADLDMHFGTFDTSTVSNRRGQQRTRNLSFRHEESTAPQTHKRGKHQVAQCHQPKGRQVG